MNVDLELVGRVQRGDTGAYDLLVRKYQVKVANLVSRYVSEQADVDDVVQESFIKAYRAIGRFRGDSAFYTWLYRIAVNTAKNHLVAQARRPVHAALEANEASGTNSVRSYQEIATPEANYASRQLAQCVSDALARLPPDLHEAIRLREIEGLSYEDIAAVMGCPIGTVRSRIFRAREAIDKAMQPYLD